MNEHNEFPNFKQRRVQKLYREQLRLKRECKEKERINTIFFINFIISACIMLAIIESIL
ncbi:hypothetical protein [Litchfieldia alkalitelluris]|uniref:hypothetical protein n=1 Tax=Litchfieldia alkalitelluris TaxID=304268 RepID=UPI001473D20C|nr:hypothetical protein [Litchfieldia alkalitelluris]